MSKLHFENFLNASLTLTQTIGDTLKLSTSDNGSLTAANSDGSSYGYGFYNYDGQNLTITITNGSGSVSTYFLQFMNPIGSSDAAGPCVNIKTGSVLTSGTCILSF